MMIVKEIADLIMYCITATVFGQANSDRKLIMRINGAEHEYTLGSAYRYLLNKQISKMFKPFRLLLNPFCQNTYIGKDEKDL
jgi:hypothetical protein